MHHSDTESAEQLPPSRVLQSVTTLCPPCLCGEREAMRILIVGNGKMGQAVAASRRRGDTRSTRRSAPRKTPGAARSLRRCSRVPTWPSNSPGPTRRRQPRATDRGGRASGHRDDRLAGAAANPSSSSDGRRLAPRLQFLGRRPLLSPRRPRPGPPLRRPAGLRLLYPGGAPRGQARRAVGNRPLAAAALLDRRTRREAPITSIRAGSIPGTHVVAYDGPSETVTLSHVARSRDAFAAGALAAAEWLPGPPGVHTFEEMLFGTRG